MRGSYNTKQREEILRCIYSMGKKHFTASDVINAIAGSSEPVGSATVYRTIDMLVESNKLRKFFIDGSTSACYQLSDKNNSEECQNHFHLKCLCCQKLFHVDCKHIEDLKKHIENDHAFDIDMSKTVLYGICNECKKLKDSKKLKDNKYA